MKTLSDRLFLYAKLMRLDKPVGILLLLWPTWWALWLASAGIPTWKNFIIFTLGVILMRSAGCVVNDLADRHFDKHVQRTERRPLAQNQISLIAVLGLAAVLAAIALGLVWQCNRLTIQLAFMGAGLAVLYPFLKRVTHLPQLGLGFAFSWGIIMAYAAVQNALPSSAWVLYGAAVLWPIIYDTYYAMVDRVDDEKIGVKSTAILFAGYEIQFLALLQAVCVILLVWVGQINQLSSTYYVALIGVVINFVYQLQLIRSAQRSNYFLAFQVSHYVGLIIFLGIALSV